MTERSSGIPRNRGMGGITRIVSARTRATTVQRVTKSKGSLDSTTETTSEHTEDIWLFSPEENRVQSKVGERITGDLGGLVIADGRVDLENGDRISHGGVEYEVDTIVGTPDDKEPDYWAVSFLRRQ